MSKLSDKLMALLNELDYLNQASNLLSWDLQTAAPENSVDDKIKALGYFSSKAFALTTSDAYGELLSALNEPEEYDALPAYMQYTVRENLRQYNRFKNVPADFYNEWVETRGKSEKVWEKAKETSDFSLFAPYLEKLIEMTRKMTAYTDPGQNVYDALLDQYARGLTTKDIDPIFEEIKNGLKPLLAAIEKKPRPDLSKIDGFYDINGQKQVQNLLLAYQGFDKNSGTTGESAHPFTMSINAGDTRVTNHFNEHAPIHPLFSAIHECGHAIFDQSIDPAFKKTAAAEVNMMDLHESQSRFFENILGRNKNYWIPIYDQVTDLLPDLKKVCLDEFTAIINDVHASLIRTEADELTYCLHIILRYEMEKAIFNDGVPVSELPALWNDKMEEMLGIRPENDAQGILQDIHWSDAGFGYFPSYLLGSVYDGMYRIVIERELGSIDELLRSGRIKEITAWLQENIHRHGALYSSKEVLRRIGAGSLSAGPLLDYFREKYTNIYNL